MRIILAPDSFKGSMTAVEAAAAMARGVRQVYPAAEVVELPLADGGEGTVDALVRGSGGELVTLPVRGPLGGPVEASFGLLGDGETAIIEMAAASGLLLVRPEQRNPGRTTTWGTGELIRAALDRGARQILVGLGGSATNDGGAGLLQALGARLLRADGTPIEPGGEGLLELDQIDLTNLDARLSAVDLVAACDVTNPLTGPTGASAVYGPQKGATPDQIERLDRALALFATVVARDLGRQVAQTPGAGAAGGVGAGLLALGARLAPGIELAMSSLRFAERLAGATLVLTGEGRTDGQTLAGKVPLGVARQAARAGVPTIVISGAVTLDAEALHGEGVAALLSVTDGPCSLAEAMAAGPALLERATARALRLVALGQQIGG
ncbi:MAG TPA: glycerate kinase [Symbiobacteriaceae bacterium]|nr:glycerate kinase [Symbiobacteriaceae bacterium]